MLGKIFNPFSCKNVPKKINKVPQFLCRVCTSNIKYTVDTKFVVGCLLFLLQNNMKIVQTLMGGDRLFSCVSAFSEGGV